MTVIRAHRLPDAHGASEADAGARVLGVTGAGGVSFCAGADLKAIASFGPRLDAPEGPFGFTRLTPSKPAIAASEGWCLAGGLGLALGCDPQTGAAPLCRHRTEPARQHAQSQS